MDKMDKRAKAAIGQQKKSLNGSTPAANEKKKLPQPLGRVVRKEGSEKPSYVPMGRVVRRPPKGKA